MSTTIICKACGNIFQGHYCNVCGQKVINRFSSSYLWQGLHEEIFEIDRGLWLTFKELWIRPGTMVLDYIHGNTKKYYGPLKYLIFWTAIVLLVVPFMPQSDVLEIPISQLILNHHGALTKEGIDDFSNLFSRLLIGNSNLYMLGIIPFVSCIGYFFFHKKFNFTEHTILYTYYFGQYSFSLLVVVSVIPFVAPIVTALIVLPVIINFFRMQKQFFQQQWPATIGKGLLIFYGGFILYCVFLFALFILAKLIF